MIDIITIIPLAMSLIGDIINDLVDSKQSLEAPLLKTKVLASRLKNNALLSWIDRELEGYPLAEELPEYRVYIAHLSMDYVLGYNQVSNQPVPTNQLPGKVRDTLLYANFSQSVAMLESSYSSNESGTLQIPLPAEMTRIVQNSITSTSKHNSRIQILELRKSIPATILAQVLASIRKRLLDFMLKLEDEFGEEADIASLRQSNQQITTIMNYTITNSGDGNVINTGDKATIKANINIQQQDFNTLANELRTQKVAEEDIAELAHIIDDDSVDRKSKSFGPLVNEWIYKMIGKAKDGAWQIGIGAAGGILTELIKAYYGMGN